METQKTLISQSKEGQYQKNIPTTTQLHSFHLLAK